MAAVVVVRVRRRRSGVGFIFWVVEMRLACVMCELSLL
jgi:hypothetical protein